jgi:hypothetical protein
VPEGEVTFPFPGLTKRGKYLPASRPDKDEPTSGGAAPILTPPDPTKALTPFAGAGLHQGHENFNRNWYTARHHIAQQIGQRFRLRVTSGYRDPAHNRAAGGVEKSFHVDGLAFDFVGAVSDMRQGYEWAKQSGMFQEIMLHNAGSGLHLHLAFLAGNPDAFRRAGPTRTPITR